MNCCYLFNNKSHRKIHGTFPSCTVFVAPSQATLTLNPSFSTSAVEVRFPTDEAAIWVRPRWWLTRLHSSLYLTSDFYTWSFLLRPDRHFWFSSYWLVSPASHFLLFLLCSSFPSLYLSFFCWFRCRPTAELADALEFFFEAISSNRRFLKGDAVKTFATWAFLFLCLTILHFEIIKACQN